jgi:hypothetical protein
MRRYLLTYDIDGTSGVEDGFDTFQEAKESQEWLKENSEAENFIITQNEGVE